MPKHAYQPDGSICPLCELKLKNAHKDLVDWFTKAVHPIHPDAHISWTYRDKASQDQAYAEGRSKLKYPLSKHNATDEDGNPQARAIDLFKLCINGLAAWDYKFFKTIADEIPAYEEGNPVIIWGGSWHFRDYPHFELV